MTAFLARLAADYPDADHRIWFLALAELYETGAGLREAVEAVSKTLRGEHGRDLEAHCRELPTRVNILLLLFFFPAVAALLFVPLLAEIVGVFES